MKVHEEKHMDCPACDRRFARQSHVLLHLERSSCFSVREVEKVALQFHDLNYCDFLFQNLSKNISFYCEHCHSKFRYLSSLYQHVEDSTDCSHLSGQYGSDLDNLASYIYGYIR